MAGKAVIVAPAGDPADSIRKRLDVDGWEVVDAAHSTPPPPDARLDALVYVSPLADHSHPEAVPADDPRGSPLELLELVERWLPALRGAEEGGAGIVAVGSSESLGWGGRPRRAAGGAALVALTRSLALALARDGRTVNLVCRLAAPDSTPAEPPYPHSLLPGEVQGIDIASAVAFFAHPRSRFITGQVLYCCGGANLLSSSST